MLQGYAQVLHKFSSFDSAQDSVGLMYCTRELGPGATSTSLEPFEDTVESLNIPIALYCLLHTQTKTLPIPTTFDDYLANITLLPTQFGALSEYHQEPSVRPSLEWLRQAGETTRILPSTMTRT